MPHIIEIDTPDHPGLDAYARLTEAQLRNRLDPANGIFIAESPKVIAIALGNGYQPLSLLAERRHLDGDAADIVARCGDIPVYTGDRGTLAHLTGYELTRGVLCAMRRPALPSAEDICQGRHRIAVLDNVVNATNTGAIFRAATALGIEAIVLNPLCCDPLNRRSVRVSMGTVFQTPWTYIGHTPGEWPETGTKALHDLGFAIAAMALDDDAIAIDDPRLEDIEHLAILMGTEGDGLSQATLRCCDYTVRIPMSNNVDSLNVAAAASVAFWQLRYHPHPAATTRWLAHP